MKPRHILIAIAFTAAQVAWAQPALATCHSVVFEATSVEIGEGGGFVQLTLVYDATVPTCEGTITYTTQDGTAQAPGDYEAATELPVTFAPGETSKEIQIGITDDHTYEAQPETFQVLLSDMPGGDINSVGVPATVTITENDVSPPPGGQSPSPSPKPSPKVIVKSPKPASVVTLSPPAPPSPSPSPSSTRLARLFSPDPTLDPRAAGEGGGFPFGLVAAIAGGVLALVAGGGWILARRSA